MDPESKYMAQRRERMNDPRSTADLINCALSASDEDELLRIIVTLHYRASRQVLEAGQELCRSSCPQERALGARVLAHLGEVEQPYPDESLGTLLGLLCDNEEPRVLRAALVALSLNRDDRIVPAAARFKSHADRDVRYGVAEAVTCHDDPLAIATLIDLTRDSDSDVRDWATFGLGSMTKVDTPQIRAALWDRVTDEDEVVRGEALVGLAERGDRRIVAPLLAELTSDSVGSLAVEAAELIADPALYPALVELESWWDVDPLTLKDALDRCRPPGVVTS